MRGNDSLETNEKNSFFNRICAIMGENPEHMAKRICDVLIELDREKETYTMQMFCGHDIARAFPAEGNYQTLLQEFVSRHCVPQDSEQVLKKLQLSCLYEECLEKEEVTFDFYFSGISMWVEITAFLMCPKQEKICLMLTDVTKEYKRAQENKKELANALGAIEAANSAKSDFLTKISHEVKMPVDSLLSMIEFSRHDIQNPAKLENYLSKMEDTSRYLLSMVDNIRDITNLESGKLLLTGASVDLTKMLSQLSYQVGKTAKSKLIHFEVEDHGSLIEDYHVIGDEPHLTQILENVLMNAIKYTPSGGRVLFSYEELEEKDGKIRMVFTVRDNGIGISKERLAHIFETYPSEQRLKWVGEGTGLGLAISYRLVHLMGGEIEAESEVAKGSCFRIFVPLEKGVHKEVEKKPQKLENLGKQILIAEANLLDCETLVTYLELNGYKVVRATHGKDVVKKFRQAEPGFYQAVILAENLPIQKGEKAAEELRGLGTPEAESIPVILTVKKLHAAEHELYQKGIITCELEKPIDADRLLAVLKQAKTIR